MSTNKSMICILWRLRDSNKYIDDLEDENDAYKQHITAQMNYDTMQRNNR